MGCVLGKEHIMLVLFVGIAALIGTVVLGAYSSESWLNFWEDFGQTPEEHDALGG